MCLVVQQTTHVNVVIVLNKILNDQTCYQAYPSNEIRIDITSNLIQKLPSSASTYLGHGSGLSTL